ncbi:hypothetical protein KR044_006534 [Drosophila immigrans]|nr:hypothetical protein KR044_006534 [Drosophila immigrans]
MTRTCRICGGADGRYWIETPVNKYAEKTFNQLLLELARLEVALDQADKLPPWLCGICAQRLENAYDFVLQARESHEQWIQKLSTDLAMDETEKGAFECLRETPIQLLEIEGVTIKMEEQTESATPQSHPNVSVDPLIKKSIVDDESDDDDDDVPLKQRKVNHTKLPINHKCNICGKAFKYVTNLFRHKQRDHPSADQGKDNYYKCDQCDKSYKYIMLLIKHKHKVHGANQLPSEPMPISRRKSSSEESTKLRPQRIKPPSTDSLVHSLIKEVKTPEEEDLEGVSSDNYYKCDQCDKSYKYIVSLIKHKHKEHSEYKDSDEDEDEPMLSKYPPAVSNSKPTRIDRRVKGFDLHRCRPNGIKEIQCMICLRQFGKLRELRNHLKAHPKDITFETHGEPIERIAEGFYRTAVESTADGLKARILNDLKVGLLGRYYSITNEARYEMNLDSSDTDSDGEYGVVERRSYACELCESPAAIYPRKFQLHEHHRQQHTWLEAPYICSRCDSRFLSAQLLDHHTNKLCQNTLKRFMCDKCPQRFFWRRNLRAHLVEHKNKQDNYPCDQCSRSFQDKSAVTKHKLMHHDGTHELIPCRWCTRTFYRPALLHKHVKRHGFTGEDLPLAETLLAYAAKSTGPKSIVCKLCDIQFISIADLRRHISMQGHSEEASNYMISTKEGFELHLDETDDSDDETTTTTTSAGRTYKCDLCDAIFQRRRDMSEHQYSLHTFDKLPHSCEHCIYKTVDKYMMQHHLRTQCLNEKKKFKCSRCGFKFMWKENLDQHMNSQHTQISSQTPIQTKRSRRFRYQCPQCWRSFVVQPSLDKHIRDMHVAKKNPGKKYLCSLCGLEALTPNKLAIHMQRHNGEKPHKCDLCDMSFTVFYELKVHRRKHTGERPYQCTFCAKDFARPDKLRRHVYMHSVKR